MSGALKGLDQWQVNPFGSGGVQITEVLGVHPRRLLEFGECSRRSSECPLGGTAYGPTPRLRRPGTSMVFVVP
jgi:hypothetical protein